METPDRLSPAPEAGAVIPILFILDAFPDPHAGTEKQFWMLFQQLDRRRFSPRIALVRSSVFLQRNVSSELLTPLEIARVASFTAVRRALQLGIRARRDGVRVAQVIFNDSSVLFPFLLWLCGIRIIVARRDLGFSYSKLVLKLLRFNRFFVDGVIANCEAVKRACVRSEGHDKNRVHVIYNGLAPEEKPTQSDHRAAWGLAADACIVLVVANLKPIKRQADAVRAFAEVLQRIPRAALVLAGEDRPGDTTSSYQSELQQLALQLGVSARVRFLGKVADAMSVIGSADVCLMCSETEGLSNTVMEYMLAGKPAVCTDVGGNAELIRDGQDGLLVETGDISGIAGALVAVLEDPERSARFGASAAQRVRLLCSGDTMVAAHEQLYRTLHP